MFVASTCTIPFAIFPIGPHLLYIDFYIIHSLKGTVAIKLNAYWLCETHISHNNYIIFMYLIHYAGQKAVYGKSIESPSHSTTSV